jgi:hypothetical protein
VEAAKEIIKHAVKSKEAASVLVAWEHTNIAYLTRALGVPANKIFEWPRNDFDTVYEITYQILNSQQAVFYSFMVKSQGLYGETFGVDGQFVNGYNKKEAFVPGATFVAIGGSLE